MSHSFPPRRPSDLDRKPRAPLGQRELERLEDFAAIIMAEAELRRTAVERDEAQHALERALDFSSIATWQLDPRTDDLRWRGATAALWGGDSESALSTGEGFYARVHPDARDQVRRALEAPFAPRQPFAMEIRHHHPHTRATGPP